MSTTVVDRLNAALSGRYRIESELGEGGMATVYLAHDLKHERKVALKVLKPELAAVVGAERFLAEIKTTANLQHPHILPLHDSGEADSFLFYVMPYVEGESLRERLDRETQLPVDEAVRIATAVANGLDYAHRQGVVHRDIKPANILLQDGEPVIADFGIALAVGGASGARLTETGLSVGTPYYMSPEQATGDMVVGPGSDTYALGCVLYEMLVGEPPYVGATAQAILGKIISGEPVSATAQRKTIPANVDAAIRRALETLSADRFTSSQEFAKALNDPGFRHGDGAMGRATASVAGLWKPLALVMSAATVVLLATSFLGREATAPAQVLRVDIQLPENAGLAFDVRNHLAMSPDGSRFVYTGRTETGRTQLWVRSLSEVEPVPLPGTEGACCATFSPDGQSIAFLDMADVSLHSVAISGGSVRTLLPSGGAAEGSRSVSWGADGYMYLGGDAIFRVPENGGELEFVTTLGDGEEGHIHPTVLPSGKGVLFVIHNGTGRGTQVAVVDLDTREHRVLAAGLMPLYAETGHLVYVTEAGELVARPFDQEGLATTGPPLSLERGLTTRGGEADLALSGNGTLLYATGNSRTESLVWVDRAGGFQPLEDGWTENFESLALSPDGRRLAVSIEDATGDHQLWTRTLPQGPLSKLTIEGGLNFRPSWSADGRRLLFVSDRGDTPNDLITRPVEGGVAEVVLDLERDLWEGEWSPDGEWLVYRVGAPPTRDLYVKHVNPDSAGRTISASDSSEEVMPTLSPDGRWLAYQSDESGREEIYVRPFPNIDDDKRPVSDNGGGEPRWSRDGTELFYKNPAGQLVATRVVTEPNFVVVDREVLFSVAQYQFGWEFCCHATYDVHPDGERFLMIRREGSGGDLVLVYNWFEELKQRMGN